MASITFKGSELRSKKFRKEICERATIEIQGARASVKNPDGKITRGILLNDNGNILLKKGGSIIDILHSKSVLVKLF